MSHAGLPVFDKTLQTTNLWLDELCETLGPDRKAAWRVLGAVLRTLRDRLPPGLGAHLGAELPLLVRGAYYDQYEPDRLPLRIRHPDDFLQLVHEELSDTRPVNARVAVRAVLDLLDEHLPEGQCAKLRRALPEPLRELWPADGWDDSRPYASEGPRGRGNGERWSPREGRGNGRRGMRGPGRDIYGYGGPPPREVRGYDDDWYE